VVLLCSHGGLRLPPEELGQGWDATAPYVLVFILRLVTLSVMRPDRAHGYRMRLQAMRDENSRRPDHAGPLLRHKIQAAILSG
jgi:hypothetical protein